MARDPVAVASSVARALRTLSRPWPTLLAGLACTVIGLLLISLTSQIPLSLMILGAGAVLAAAAVSRRLQTASWELEDRVESAGLLALAAFVALLTFFGVKRWDSGALCFGVLTGLALIGSFIVLLPRTGRRIVASLLLVLHFGGILAATTAVPPRNDPAPWLSMQVWTHFYRHYLVFAYFTNAYHFYSPDPGPPTMLWFHVEYADGSSRWVKLPNRKQSPVLLHHQRMLATSESTVTPGGLPLLKDEFIPEWEAKFKRPYEILPGIPHDSWETILERRRIGMFLPFKDVDGRDAPIGFVDDEPSGIIGQYSEPQETARRLIASYCRHIARTSPHLENPKIPVKSVRLYRATHNLLSPHEYAEGKDPLDDTTFMPFYMGKYDIDGRLLDPRDPFLYWYLPILNVPLNYGAQGVPLRHAPQAGPQKLIDFVEIHAAQSDKFANTRTPKKP